MFRQLSINDLPGSSGYHTYNPELSYDSDLNSSNQSSVVSVLSFINF